MAKLVKAELYVVFIDILGFESLLNDDNFETHIQNIVDVLQERSDFDSTHHSYLKYLAASDTVVITGEKGHGPHLLWKISQLQNALLRRGFASRGAISYGEVYSLSDQTALRNIFGTAYVDAFRMEKELAIYPRVVMKPAVANQIKDEFTSKSKTS